MRILKLTFVQILFTTLTCMAQYPVGPDGYACLGVLNGKQASEIKSSTWSIGGETLDRDYADYDSYKKYLGPLGAKRIRLQGGWAKCEKVKGTYDFAWLDNIINDAISQGVQPWVELSYGNPAYEGGGEPKLGGSLPESEEALKAWDNWVTAMAGRYKHKVTEWEIWNEPNLTPKITGKTYAVFYIRTVEIIKKIQPEARIMALSYAGVQSLGFLEAFFDILKEKGKLHLVNTVTFHGYPDNPDNIYPPIEILRDTVHRYAPGIKLMQGENGCPSTPASNSVGALRRFDWTEFSQAKYVARRLLGDYGRNIETNLFTLSDLHYKQGDHLAGVNSKGLLKTHDDKTVDRPKLSYYTAQRIMGYFNADEVSRLSDDNTRLLENTDKYSLFGFRHLRSALPVYAVWDHESRPAESYRALSNTLVIEEKVPDPVYVDLLSGYVYAIPLKNVEYKGRQTIIKEIPLPDYPVLIGSKKSIPFSQKRYYLK